MARNNSNIAVAAIIGVIALALLLVFIVNKDDTDLDQGDSDPSISEPTFNDPESVGPGTEFDPETQGEQPTGEIPGSDEEFVPTNPEAAEDSIPAEEPAP